MAAVAYNLKKMLKFPTKKGPIAMAMVMQQSLMKEGFYMLMLFVKNLLNFSPQRYPKMVMH